MSDLIAGSFSSRYVTSHQWFRSKTVRAFVSSKFGGEVELS